jgi:hypothetical protein
VCAALAPSSAGRQVRRLPVVDRGKAAVGIVALGEFAVDIPEIIRANETAATVIVRPRRAHAALQRSAEPC